MILLLGFALPPLLACIGGTQAMAQEHAAAMASCHESAERLVPAHDREPYQPRHEDCIGCIAPLAIAMFRPVSEPDFHIVVFGPMLTESELVVRMSAPEPPPPKNFV